MYRFEKKSIYRICPVCRSNLFKVKRRRADYIYVCRRKKYIAIVMARKILNRADSVRVEYYFLYFK
jgi:hypothetical protein